jgi:uncharacterized coiled-coil protein SlyX
MTITSYTRDPTINALSMQLDQALATIVQLQMQLVNRDSEIAGMVANMEMLYQQLKKYHNKQEK